VLRRPLVVLGAALAALTLAAPALAARVHVRVEGPSATIFGATEPLLAPKVGVIHPPDGADVTVNVDTPFGALERASVLGEFYYRVESFSFGPYVSWIGRYEAAGPTGWVYKVNGVSPPVGAVDYHLKAGDRVLWYFARFGASGGPQTLRIRAFGSRGCYRARAENDNGKLAAVSDVAFVVNQRRVVTSANGTICPGQRWHTLRARKHGFVRSQVVVRPGS
jgi:Domain of unknown function (DUF4430)